VGEPTGQQESGRGFPTGDLLEKNFIVGAPLKLLKSKKKKSSLAPRKSFSTNHQGSLCHTKIPGTKKKRENRLPPELSSGRNEKLWGKLKYGELGGSTKNQGPYNAVI